MDNIKGMRNNITSEIAMTSRRRSRRSSKKKNILSLTSNNVLRGIVFSEILGKPKGIRKK